MQKKYVHLYGNVFRLNPGRAAVALSADGAVGVGEDGGGGGGGGGGAGGGVQDIEEDLKSLCSNLDLSQLARAMAWARTRTPFYPEEFERYRRRHPQVSDLVIHVLTFVSTMEHYQLAPAGLKP